MVFFKDLSKVLGFSFLHVSLTALLLQLVFLYYGGLLDFFEDVGISFWYRTAITEVLLSIVFFYYLYILNISRPGVLLAILFFLIFAFFIGRLSKNSGHAFIAGVLSPYMALVILVFITYDPYLLLSFAFTYGYTALQAVLSGFFATIGAYSVKE